MITLSSKYYLKQYSLFLSRMKKGVKIFLLIILSCCYLNTVFEFSDTEKKINFENETHSYINKEQVFLQNQLNIAKDNFVDFLSFSYIPYTIVFSEKSISGIHHSSQSNFLLDKIFLRNSVLRI